MSERFWTKVKKTDSCWLWIGCLNAAGYGRFYGRGRVNQAHRIAYELIIGPVPEGLQLDHLCRVRRCVNPAHLEAVTRRANILRGVGRAAKQARQVTCIRGHIFDEVNTYWRPDGSRRACRTCRRLKGIAYRASHKQVA